jgi:hypothetical protein
MVNVHDVEKELKGEVLSETRVTASSATGQFVYKPAHSLELSLSFTRNGGFKYDKDI